MTKTAVQPKKMTMKQKRIAREIRKLQESPKLFLPQATFRRLVTSVTDEVVGAGYRFNAQSIITLQTAAEDKITKMFQGANVLAKHDGRDTVTPADVKAFEVVRNM